MEKKSSDGGAAIDPTKLVIKKRPLAFLCKSATNVDIKSEAAGLVEAKKNTETGSAAKLTQSGLDLNTRFEYYSNGRGRKVLERKRQGPSDSEASPEPLIKATPLLNRVQQAEKAGPRPGGPDRRPTMAEIVSRNIEPKQQQAHAAVVQDRKPPVPLRLRSESGHVRDAKSEERCSSTKNEQQRFACWADIRGPEFPQEAASPDTLGSQLESLKLTPEEPQPPTIKWREEESPPTPPTPQRCEHQSWTRWELQEPRRSLESPNEELIRFTQEKAKEWKAYPMNLIDTHCHFDMLFSRMNFSGDLFSYFEDFKNFYLKNIESFINIACNPVKFSTQGKMNAYRRRMAHSKVYHVFGCHPHFANNWTEEIGILIFNNLNRDDIIAIGECGLDTSHKNNVDIELQKEVFKSQLRIAKKTAMPVVIHARGAEDQVYQILKENLPETHRIHLHCFCGGWKLAQLFLETFPNLCIGVTPLLTYSKVAELTVTEMIENIPLERLLLETDAPYFVPRLPDFPSTSIELSHPAFIYATAESVAHAKKLTVSQVLDANRENVRKVYRI